MSTALFPGTRTPPQFNTDVDAMPRMALQPLPPQDKTGRKTGFVRRRGTLEQGRALEMLGHAVEYLVDCGMFEGEAREPQADQESIQMLMRLSRAVFSECAEVVPLRRRLQQLILRKS